MKSTNVVSFHSPYAKNSNFVLVKTNGTIFKVYKNLDSYKIMITFKKESNEMFLAQVLPVRIPYNVVCTQDCFVYIFIPQLRGIASEWQNLSDVCSYIVCVFCLKIAHCIHRLTIYLTRC